jgi:hypothetical protein
MPRARRRIVSLRSVAALLLLACSSCVSFHRGELEQLNAKDLAAETPLPAISYECKPGPGTSPAEGSLAWPGASTERLFRSAFVDAHDSPAANDLHLELRFQSEMRHPFFTFSLGLLTLLSIGLIPTYAHEDLALLARVEFQGQFLHEYEYHDRQNTWVEVFLLPWGLGNDPKDVQQEIFQNLLLHFLRDLRRDLPRIAPGATAHAADPAKPG